MLYYVGSDLELHRHYVYDSDSLEIHDYDISTFISVLKDISFPRNTCRVVVSGETKTICSIYDIVKFPDRGYTLEIFHRTTSGFNKIKVDEECRHANVYINLCNNLDFSLADITVLIKSVTRLGGMVDKESKLAHIWYDGIVFEVDLDETVRCVGYYKGILCVFKIDNSIKVEQLRSYCGDYMSERVFHRRILL